MVNFALLLNYFDLQISCSPLVCGQTQQLKSEGSRLIKKQISRMKSESFYLEGFNAAYCAQA